MAEHAEGILNDLIRQRRRMRSGGAEAALLEANRLGIVYWRMQLDRARCSRASIGGEH